MKKFVSVLLLSLPMVAAASNCDEISASIAEKITNNGVQATQFQLKFVPADQTQQVEGKIVGSCDRGKQNIVYVRLDGVVPSSNPAAVPATSEAVPTDPQAESAPEVETQVNSVETEAEPAVVN